MTYDEQPTNAALLAEMRANHAEVTTRLGAVERQVRITNGRVTKLENDKIARDAVSADRQLNPMIKQAEQVVVKNYWNDPKLVAATTALLAAATAFVIANGGV